MKRGTESIVRLGKGVEPADFSGINVLSTVILGKKESATKDFNGLFITDAVLLGKKISHAAVVTATVHGVSPLSLPSAVANSLSYVKAFGGTEQRNIPQPYTQVNYVTNTAKTAANTGIMIDFAKNYEFEVECRATTGSWFILQSRKLTSLPNTGITGSGTGDTILLVVDGTTVCTSRITRTLGNRLYVKATLNNGVGTLYVKDITAGTEDTVTGTYSTSATNPTVPMYLLGNAAGQYVDTDSNVYMARIKENGVTIMDYVPAKQDTTAGFYDKASGTFKTALTPGNLSAGAVVSPSPDTPVDIVSNNGVLKASPNLLNNPTWLSGYINATGLLVQSSGSALNFYPVSPNTTYTFSYTKGNASNFYDRIAGYSSKTENSFTELLSLKDFRSYAEGARLTSTFTTGANTNYIRIGTFCGNEPTGTPAPQPQLELGSTATPYMPYGIYADGTVETINVHGKNLFDGESEPGYISDSGSYTASVNAVRTISFIPVSPNKQYTFSADGNPNTYLRIHCYGINKEWISMLLKLNNGKTGSVTIPSNAYYLKASYSNLFTNIQIEQGDTATEYQPYYDGGTATAEMLLKVGDYQDVQSIIDGVVTRNVGVKVLDGSEDWNNGIVEHRFVINTPFDNTAQLTDAYVGYSNCYSVVPKSTGLQSQLENNQCGWNTLQRFTVRDDRFTTAEQLKQYLAAQYAAGTPVIVIYPLATPTTESVTGQTLQVQAGDNVLEITQASLSDLELEAQYQKREQ